MKSATLALLGLAATATASATLVDSTGFQLAISDASNSTNGANHTRTGIAYKFEVLSFNSATDVYSVGLTLFNLGGIDLDGTVFSAFDQAAPAYGSGVDFDSSGEIVGFAFNLPSSHFAAGSVYGPSSYANLSPFNSADAALSIGWEEAWGTPHAALPYFEAGARSPKKPGTYKGDPIEVKNLSNQGIKGGYGAYFQFDLQALDGVSQLSSDSFFENNGDEWDMYFRTQQNNTGAGSDKFVIKIPGPMIPVPEPSTYGLIGALALAVAIGLRRLRKSPRAAAGSV